MFEKTSNPFNDTLIALKSVNFPFKLPITFSDLSGSTRKEQSVMCGIEALFGSFP